MSYDYGAVRIAEDYLCAHVDEQVEEEKAALEHLLVDQHAARELCGHHQHYAEEVRGQARPRCVGNGHYGAVEEGFDDVALFLGDIDIVPERLSADTQPAALLGDYTQDLL